MNRYEREGELRLNEETIGDARQARLLRDVLLALPAPDCSKRLPAALDSRHGFTAPCHAKHLLIMHYRSDRVRM
jgi:hypothetical protein